MEESKPWYLSIGTVGGIITILAPALGALFHVTIGIEETNKIAVDLVGIADLIGGLMAIYGRYRANTKIIPPAFIAKFVG